MASGPASPGIEPGDTMTQFRPGREVMVVGVGLHPFGRFPDKSLAGLAVNSQDIIHKWKSADRRQTTQALMLAMMIIEVKPGAKPANTVA